MDNIAVSTVAVGEKPMPADHFGDQTPLGLSANPNQVWGFDSYRFGLGFRWTCQNFSYTLEKGLALGTLYSLA